MSHESPPWLNDSSNNNTPVKQSSSSVGGGKGNEALDTALLSSPTHKDPSPQKLDSSTPLKQVATGEYHSPNKGGDRGSEVSGSSRKPTPPPEPRNTTSRGSNASKGRTPPSQQQRATSPVNSPAGVLSLGVSSKPTSQEQEPVAAGSGMAPSLLQRRKQKMEESLSRSNNDEEEKTVPPPPVAAAPKSLVQQALVASPSRGGLPLSLSPRKGVGGGDSPGLGGMALPSAEVQDIEYQLAALRSIRRPQTGGDEDSTASGATATSNTSLPPKRGAGVAAGAGSNTPPSAAGKRQSSVSPRQAKFGRRAGAQEDDASTDGPTPSTASARRSSKDAPKAKSTGGGSSSGGGIDMSRIVKGLQSGNWQDQTQGLNSLRDVLRSIQPTTTTDAVASGGPGEGVRQHLHDCVHGVLTICESPRSSVSKLAMDTVGLLCRSVTLRNTTAGGGAGGVKHQSHNTIDHFIEPISSKLVLKGGSTSAKFLFDSALFSLRELLESVTSSTRAMSGLLSITGVKTEKSKVLWAEAIGHCLEVSTEAGSQCFAGKG